MYSGEKVTTQDFDLDVEAPSGASFRDYATQDRDEDAESKEIAAMSSVSTQSILDDTLLACKNLGFSDASIIPLAQKILKENDIKRPEQLVHLVLKEV